MINCYLKYTNLSYGMILTMELINPDPKLGIDLVIYLISYIPGLW